MARKRLTIALLSLFPLCGMLGLLSACGTIAGFGRDTTNAANWASEKITGSPTSMDHGSSTTAAGTSAAPAAPAASGSTVTPAAAMTESQVKQDLQTHGYTHVSNLHPSGGDWVGTAVDNTGKSVNVVVSRSGTILTTP